MREAPSVILKPSHPRRPVFGLHTSGDGPGAGRVKFRVPLERPILLYAHLPHRPVQKEHVNAATVTIQADALDVRIVRFSPAIGGLLYGLRALVDHRNALDQRGSRNSQRPPEFQCVRLPVRKTGPRANHYNRSCRGYA